MDIRGHGDTSFYQFCTEIDGTRRAIEALSGETLIGLDTETYWEAAARRSYVSLVQIAPQKGRILVIDALAVDLDVIRPLIEAPDVLMAAHNASFDQMVLAGAGLRPVSFVDTLRLARRTLTLASYSLQTVTSHLLGIRLDKSLQRSNWRCRPLTPAQIGYAATDALITLRVFEELRRIIDAVGNWPDALRAATLAGKAEAVRGAIKRQKRQPAIPHQLVPPLTSEERRVVRHLKQWRLEQSRAQRVPAYMICPDRTLEHLARVKPVTLADLRAVFGLGEAKIARYGDSLLAALRGVAGI